MALVSRALLQPLLPTCFRRLASAPSPEEAREIEKGRCSGDQKRLVAETGRRSGEPVVPRPGRRISGHGETVVVHDHGRYGNMSLGELLAYETEKRQWIEEQKRSIAEAMQRAGGPDPRWNSGSKAPEAAAAAGRRNGSTFLEELSAYEIKKRRWIAEQKRPMAEARRGWSKAGPRRSSGAVDSRKRDSPKVHSLVTEEEIGDQAKPRSPPVRVTYAGRFGPESDAVFLKAMIAAWKSGGEGDSASQRDSDHRAEMDEAHLRRQRYLRYYCPFQSEEEESVPEKTKAAAPDDAAEVERKEPVRPANDPGTEAEFVMRTIEKNQGRDGDGVVPNESSCPGAGEVRNRNDDYYAMRREFLKSFHFTRG